MTLSAIAQGPPAGPPAFTVDLDAAAIRRFEEQGFLSIDRITTDEEVAWLGAVWDELFTDRRKWFDVARPFGANDEVSVGQLLFPERYAPVLRETQYFRNARRIASRLLGESEDDLDAWGHMVLKPARTGRATPWHQDEAYWEPEFDYNAVGAWLPLEDVDGNNGCMCFLPGSHRGELRSHRHMDQDPRLHLLELEVPMDDSNPVAVPLRVGGATFHHPRTVHSTARNRTERPRRAFANEFQTRPVQRAVRADKPWIDEQRRVWAAEQERVARAKA